MLIDSSTEADPPADKARPPSPHRLHVTQSLPLKLQEESLILLQTGTGNIRATHHAGL